MKFLKLQKQSKFLVYFFQVKSCAFILYKKGLHNILGDFFTISFGHTATRATVYTGNWVRASQTLKQFSGDVKSVFKKIAESCLPRRRLLISPPIIYFACKFRIVTLTGLRGCLKCVQIFEALGKPTRSHTCVLIQKTYVYMFMYICTYICICAYVFLCFVTYARFWLYWA